MPRQGKIARLPRPMRDELNRRLSANEDGASLLNWLNASPAVQAILARDFGSEPVTKQNLYEWRNGGFIESQTRQELLEQAGELATPAAECDPAGCGNLIGHLVALLAVRYAAVLARWNDGDNEALRVQLRVLHTFTRDLAALHRINQFAERQKRDQARSDRKAKKTADAATTMPEPNPSRARAYDRIMANRQDNPAPVPTPDFALVAAAREPAVARHSAGATAMCVADNGVPHDIGTPVLNPDRAKSCAPELQPLPPQPGFRCQAEVRLPDRGSSKTKNDCPTIVANGRPLVSAPALGLQPRTSVGRGSTIADSPLDKVVSVLIAPGNAVDQFVAANTRPPEVGVLPSALRREIADALLR